MPNNYVPTLTALQAGELARANDINTRYNYVESAFDKLPTPATSGQGFSAPVPVGTPTSDEHATTKIYAETVLVAVAEAAALAYITPSTNAAAASAAAALTSENNAASSATAAATSATNAATSETNAATSETNAGTSETNASASEAAAASSESASATSATNAAASAVAAAASETAAGTSATNAATSATDAATSATAAAGSESTVTASATAAATSEANAAASATAANTSKVAAEAAKTAAQTAQTNAETAETNAETAETNAAASATSSANSATAASTSETNAANSASAAASSATAAANSATDAANSATSAATSETNATTAANQAALVTTQINNFFDTYFVSSSEPTGSNLTAGDLWYDTNTSILKVYTASGFINVNSSVNGTSERFEYVVGTPQSTSAGQYSGSTTTFPSIYDPGFVDVYKNGLRLPPADFTATSGSEITLGSAASSGDTVSVVGYGNFQTANHYSKSQSDIIYGQRITDLEDEILLQLGV